MTGYELSPGALGDLRRLVAYTERNRGLDAALALEGRLLYACERLAMYPGLGHRRPDLTALQCFFYAEDPYLILYARDKSPKPVKPPDFVNHSLHRR